MEQVNDCVKTVLLASGSSSDLECLETWLKPLGCRTIRAENFLSLINSLFHYRVHLLVSDVELPDISMSAFLPFLRERFRDVKVILTMKQHYPELELSLRKHNILYLMHWPMNGRLLASVVEKGLEKYSRGLISA